MLFSQMSTDLELTTCLDERQTEHITRGHGPTSAMVGICVQGANHFELHFI